MDLMDSFAGRRVPPAVTDAGLALLLIAGCAATPLAIPPGRPELRSPDAWFLVLVLMSALPLAVHRRSPLPALLVMSAAAAALQGLHYIPQLSGPEGTSIGPTYVGVATGVFLTAVRSTPVRRPWSWRCSSRPRPSPSRCSRRPGTVSPPC